ncbi:MAG: electron transfer flavoprotein-ubiquinone oxidoreductase [Bdellovibrionaceae bacterium]|nr:electron transfer flavoprotein-ubiquinone oxidoreductase [Pseudobdellovibrionaceae bacterium]
MASGFKPVNHQPELDLNRFIIENPQVNEEECVPMDVLFVGGGPAGLCGAIRLARKVQELKTQDPSYPDVEIGVLEKAQSLGGHSLSGAIINPVALMELFPELDPSEFPFKHKVDSEKVYVLTPKKSFRIPTPPTMKNHGFYAASICEVTRWLGEKAEALGINVFTSFPAESLLIKDGQVIGVRTVEAGLNRDGTPGAQHMPHTDILASVTVLCEGTRGPLTQSYLKWSGQESMAPQIYALGVKEIWRLKKPLDSVIHTMGWPLGDTFGGSFAYPMGDDQMAIGLVGGLDYKSSNLDVHGELQNLKAHPLFHSLLEGAELVEWGAKTIPEGGFHSLPERLSGNGIMLCGDAVGMVNVPALKGIHYAMKSGILAADTLSVAIPKAEFSREVLKSYDDAVKNSFIYKDLYKVRNMRQAFKSGFIIGGIKALLMTLTGGAFPPQAPHIEEDADEQKLFKDPKNYPGLKKVDGVYQSGNKTRDDIPSHLTVGQDITAELADFYSSLCPAGVYERQGDQLVVNAPNCVDCKATDVLGPRWQPREGGSGPNYTFM